MSGHVKLSTRTNPPVCFCKRPCHWWKEFGPPAYGEIANFEFPWPTGRMNYDPKVHDRFVCED
ncbi:hypothetical protein J4E85_007109 [Alternaria conjuncta]|uniref:uncharacterized protein n=1 Tax=Alternaria viburni TaxID=566460 RepID=UPI0020C59A55|nr:uncharacterized protein J4E79_010355 [Alternaria viburni]XP_051324417.1 uncharacterized protein J4E85_007109 [Alternaria conjuncta]KAI4647204.1 hypothetical protein J4E79_010355 [Alternaria viburni]KAI4925232.1 hypothetical protein J4E85_007109 [Alternaria conjuncta]